MRINIAPIASAIFVMFVAFSISATEVKKPLRRTKLSPEERKVVRANIEKMMMKKNGGYIIKPGSVKGKIIFANCQSLIPAEKLALPAYAIHRYLKVNTANTNYIPVNCQTASRAVKDLDASAAIFVVQSDDYPPMLVAPECKWAIVNVNTLNNDNPSKDILYTRLNKEIMRSVAYLCGGVNSAYKGSILSCGNIKQLDSITSESLPPDVYSRMQEYLPNIEMSPAIVSTYLKACEEGWAPAPTNEYQKAIWEQVKADKERGPTNPIKIPMPKKK